MLEALPGQTCPAKGKSLTACMAFRHHHYQLRWKFHCHAQTQSSWAANRLRFAVGNAVRLSAASIHQAAEATARTASLVAFLTLYSQLMPSHVQAALPHRSLKPFEGNTS